MNFASLEFPIFFAVVLGLCALGGNRGRIPILLLASWFFYAWWKPAFLILLLGNTLFDYTVGRLLGRVENPAARRALLVAGIAANLSVLALFKYEAFGAESLNACFRALQFHAPIPVWHWVLPLGISFYTFHSLAYIADVYRKRVPVEKSLPHYALYVCFFPLLVAGPIERAATLLPQFHRPAPLPNAARFLGGLTQALFGLWKKVVIADALALHVNWVFAAPREFGGGTLLLGVYLFAFQIYCDFSGYSDIALGTARMLGIEVRENFRSPYFAASLTDFWRRWHISLSTWVRDYIYIPLGGSRGSKPATWRNLCVTMLLAGLWHGAAWTFIVWGAWHSLLLAREKFLPLRALGRGRALPGFRGGCFHALSVLLTFHLVCLGWIFFRAGNWADSVSIFSGLINPAGWLHIHILHKTSLLSALPQLALLLGFEAIWLRRFASSSQAFAMFFAPIEAAAGRLRWKIPLALNAFFVLAILLLGVEQGSTFIYFQF